MRHPRPRKLYASIVPIGLALTGIPLCAHPESAAGTGSAHARIDLRIVVPEVVRASLAQPSALTIQPEDVNRGYIDVGPATSALVTSNGHDGYALSVAFDPSLASKVVVRIGDQRLSAERSGSEFMVAARKMLNAPVAIGYRIFLAPSIAAGTYRWPVALRFGRGVAEP